MAEGARLESVYTGNRIVGSNPTLSATALQRFSRPSTLSFRTTQNRKSPARQPDFFEGASEFSVHGVDDQISAAQQEDRQANEQKNRHVALRGLFALA